MKKCRGSSSMWRQWGWLMILALWPTLLMAAKDCTYQVSVSKRDLYLKEPFVVTFSVEQTDPKIVMFFDFEILEEGRFKAIRLDKQVDDAYHHKKVRFVYLVFPLKTGSLTMHFKFLIRRTNDATIAVSTTGGRYNFKDVQTWDTTESVSPERIVVRPLPTRADLVGDFVLHQRIDKHTTSAYHPVYVTIELGGVGYPPSKDILGLKIPDVQIFADKPEIVTQKAKDGIHYRARYTYAIVATHDFTVPPIDLHAFSPKKERSYTLHAPPIDVHVVPIKRERVLDRTTRPPTLEERWRGYLDWIAYLVVFFSGYVTALLVSRLRVLLRQKGWFVADAFKKSVKAAKSEKELLHLLIKTDPMRYAAQIEALEAAIYHGERVKLAAIKKEVLRV